MIRETALDIPGLVLEVELTRSSHSVTYRARGEHGPCIAEIAGSDRPGKRWLRRAAAALAAVRHRGVPRVLEVGEIDDRPYLVTELVEGETLESRLRRKPLSMAETLLLAGDLADIAAAIHARRIVHRNINPKTIVLDADGVVHLVGFGLLGVGHRRLDLVGEEDERSFAAPEQLREPQLVDVRADLFAMGRVLRTCLAAIGTRPPAAIAGILGHLLVEDPRRRYASATAFVDDLSRALAGAVPRGPHRSADRDRSTSVVGRKKELGALRSHWENANDGRGRAVILEGRPGSGKTRTLDAFVTEIEATGRCMLLRADGASSGPLAAVRILLEDWMHRIDRMPAVAAAERLDALARACAGPAAPIVASVAPGLADVLGESNARPEQEHEAFVEALAGSFVALARVGGPMLLLVDDLQWIDPLSREVLVRVAAESSDVPLLFLAAARDDARGLASIRRFVRTLGTSRLRVVSMERLEAFELRELISEELGWDAVDARLTRLVAGLCDGTILGALELLGALIDGGALRPYGGTWSYDPDLAERTRLPTETRKLLDRRVKHLPAATLEFLQTAAILGAQFTAERAAAALGKHPEEAVLSLVDASLRALIELDRAGRPMFVHESVREAMVRPLAERERRALHQRVAEVLDDASDDPGLALVVADHFAVGEPERDPERVHAVAARAALQAAEELDHETALRHFELAERMARIADIRPDEAFLRGQAETRIQAGLLQASLEPLRRLRSMSADPLSRARIAGRIAWVHGALDDPQAAWAALDEAFTLLGEKMPTEAPHALVRSAFRTLRSKLPIRQRQPLRSRDRERIELLCRLHYQNGRLGVEHGKPLRTLQSSPACLALGERLGASPEQAQAAASHGVFMIVLGRKAVGLRYLERAKEMAERLGDARAVAEALKFKFVGLGWAGRFDEAHELGVRCLEAYGPWHELSEYCLMAVSPRMTEAVRGRPRAALVWSRYATARVRRHGRVPAVFVQIVVPGIKASLATLGQEESDDLLLTDLPKSPDPRITPGFHRWGAWGPRATELVEGGRVDELDAFVDACEAEGLDVPRSHLMLGEYFVSVAQGYAHRSLTCPPDELPTVRRRFARALADLRKAARVPLFAAHVHALQGISAVLDKRPRAARAAFAQARTLGEREAAPWVLHAVARGEAHLLRNHGQHEEARERARAAARLAAESGAVARHRWVEEEFDL